jgi:hypothetical protein
MMLRTYLAFALLTSSAFAAHSTVRCTNPAGTVIAYAESALGCPAGSQAKGEVAPANQPTASQMAQTKAQVDSDRSTGNALESKRLKEERAQAKAIAALQKDKDSKAKRCKAADVALKRAQERYSDNPKTSSKGNKASSKASKNPSHTVVREENEKSSKSRKKAKRGLESAQAKRDSVCSE